ncbi:hypothetical protein CO613_01545 [Lysobacteraceae bacterium NML07-0707]|nr:hypothetical protein CO613_01545 [Xanthomonadaceae bacterium NML07-0707]
MKWYVRVRNAWKRPFFALWGWPIILGVLSLTGLMSALVSDAWGDIWSWFALGLPILVMAWFGFRSGDSGGTT